MTDESVRRSWWRLAVGGVLLGIVCAQVMIGDKRLRSAVAGAGAAQANEPDTLAGKLGIDRAEQRHGTDTPTGKGIAVGHVEGAVGEYAPRQGAAEFRGVNFTLKSGPSKVSGHTHATAKVIYGPNGLAPGVTDVWCMTSQDWMTKGFLRAGTHRPPAITNRRVWTHSWVSHSPAAVEVLRRIDYAVDVHDVIMVVGVDNGRDKPVPPLLSSAYNAIAVGVWDGNSSGGYTRVDGEGRCKPDLVAPHGLTSYSTPAVAAAAARLLEAADVMADAPSAKRSEVIKAVLMAGAEKPTGWRADPGKPLDPHYGAGRARFDRSYDILLAGPQQPGRVDAQAGWDFRILFDDRHNAYVFDVTKATGPASFMLVWHRRIDGRTVKLPDTSRRVWHNGYRMADFDLRVAHRGADGQTAIIGKANGETDNVEHLYFPTLAPGRYVVQVSRKDLLDESWDYALAWRVATSD